MSRLFLLLTTLFCSFAALAQKPVESTTTEFPTKDGQLYYEGVVDVVPTAKQADLYRAGRTWFVDTYVGTKEVLQLDDKADGKMIGKGGYQYSFVIGITISQIFMRFTLALDVKDGKYRYRIYDFAGDNTNTTRLRSTDTSTVGVLDYNQGYIDLKAGKRTKFNLKVLQGMDTQVQLMVASLQKAMLASSASKDDF
jgi:hypothetical protein